MVRRGDPPPRSVRPPTIGDAISRYETLLLICHDCNPDGAKFNALEFATFHKLSRKLTLWGLAQHLYCSKCESRNISLDTLSPYPYGHEYRLARKSFQR